MIDKKKLVVTGDYALLESTGEIYIRRSNKWVLDKSVSVDRFLETNKIFCNIQKDCFEVKDKCMSTKDAKRALIDEHASKIL